MRDLIKITYFYESALFFECHYFIQNDFIMEIKNISYDIKTSHTYIVMSHRVKSVPGEIAGTTANFTSSFSRIAKFFFRTLGPLCTCPSIRTGCIDWFRNHPRVKQIYRVVVKKKTRATRPLCRNDKQRTWAVIALNFAITV